MDISFSLEQLAFHLNGTAYGDPVRYVQSIASLTRAKANQIAYFDNPLLLKSLEATEAGIVLLPSQFVSHCPVNCIVVSNPLQSMMELSHLFSINAPYHSNIHSSAKIAPAHTLVEKAINVGANTTVDEKAILQQGVNIGANCYIAADVEIGSNSKISNGVTILSGTKIGCNCFIDNGSVIGAMPFNALKEKGKWQEGPVYGALLIGDGVRIGANVVLTMGALGDTVIGDNVYIDNLVQIAHDVMIDKHTSVAACAAIGAFTKIGAHCIIGGASSIAAHVQLADDIVITGMSTVNRSLYKSGIYSSGTVVSEHHRWRRNAARFRRLDDYVNRLVKLEREVIS